MPAVTAMMSSVGWNVLLGGSLVVQEHVRGVGRSRVCMLRVVSRMMSDMVGSVVMAMGVEVWTMRMATEYYAERSGICCWTECHGF